MNNPTVEIGGIYKHYKGNLYKVLDIAKSSDDLADYVFYECLYANSLGQKWIRSLQEFTGTLEIDGKQVTRFALQDSIG